MPSYDPWSDLARRLPHVSVIGRYALGPSVAGGVRGHRIWLDRGLDAAGRRSTLAHEIVHLDRGMPVGDERSRRREEVVVESVAARRLVSLAELVDACRWCPDATDAVLAEMLSVDVSMVRMRLRTLTDEERKVVSNAIRGCREP